MGAGGAAVRIRRDWAALGKLVGYSLAAGIVAPLLMAADRYFTDPSFVRVVHGTPTRLPDLSWLGTSLLVQVSCALLLLIAAAGLVAVLVTAIRGSRSVDCPACGQEVSPVPRRTGATLACAACRKILVVDGAAVRVGPP